MPGELIPFPQPRRNQPGANTEVEPFRVVFEIGESRFAIDRRLTVTDLPSAARQVNPIRTRRYTKRRAPSRAGMVCGIRQSGAKLPVSA